MLFLVLFVLCCFLTSHGHETDRVLCPLTSPLHPSENQSSKTCNCYRQADQSTQVRSGRSEASAARGRHCAVRPAPLNNALFPPLTRVRSPVPQPYQHRGHRPRRLRQVHHHRTLDLQAGRCVPLVGNPQLSVCSCEVADALPLAALLQASTSV